MKEREGRQQKLDSKEQSAWTVGSGFAVQYRPSSLQGLVLFHDFSYLPEAARVCEESQPGFGFFALATV